MAPTVSVVVTDPAEYRAVAAGLTVSVVTPAPTIVTVVPFTRAVVASLLVRVRAPALVLVGRVTVNTGSP